MPISLQRSRVGEMRQRATIRTANTSADGRGGFTISSWTDVVTVWANVEPTGGREFLQGAAIRNAQGYTVKLRYHSSVTPATRLYVQPAGLLLEVLEVVNLGQRNRWIVCGCVRVDS